MLIGDEVCANAGQHPYSSPHFHATSCLHLYQFYVAQNSEVFFVLTYSNSVF
jgi:hypothetical protein